MSNTLRDAIQRIRAGDRIQGRRLLIEVLKVDPENVTALLWMSILVSRKHRQQVLERVLEIDPQNEAARQALNELQETSKTGQKIPPGPQVSFKKDESSIIEYTNEDTLKQCPFCAEMIKAAAIVCRYCGRDLLVPYEKHQTELQLNEGESKGDFVKKATKTGSFFSFLKAPFLVLIIMGGLLFLTCIMCGLFAAYSPQEESPTREIPPTYTPRTSGQQPSSQQTDDDPLGIGYIWLEDSPNTPIPVISYVHDRFPIDVEELARWVLYGEACLVEPGTRAFIEDYGLVKVEVTIQEGECVDYNGWIVSEAWQDHRP